MKLAIKLSILIAALLSVYSGYFADHTQSFIWSVFAALSLGTVWFELKHWEKIVAINTLLVTSTAVVYASTTEPMETRVFQIVISFGCVAILILCTAGMTIGEKLSQACIYQALLLLTGIAFIVAGPQYALGAAICTLSSVLIMVPIHDHISNNSLAGLPYLFIAPIIAQSPIRQLFGIDNAWWGVLIALVTLAIMAFITVLQSAYTSHLDSAPGRQSYPINP